MAAAYNAPYRVEPKNAHRYTVILLHGRDSDSREFADEFFESEASELAGKPRTRLDLFSDTRWVFPSAPTLHSERFGTEISQWFDMWSVENPAERPELQRPGLSQSIEQILAVVEEEEKVLPRGQIFLGGISQGFATAAAACFAEMRGGFGGLIGLCGWLPLAPQARECEGEDGLEKLQAIFGNGQATEVDADSVRKMPIFLGHSADDGVVPIENGRELRDIVSSHGLQVEWREYEDGGHWVNEPQGVDDIAGFLRRYPRDLQPAWAIHTGSPTPRGSAHKDQDNVGDVR
ncbi:lysophospholipase II [Durotheca rogersii]|uniref:lysophospholipase II n=1 Tax=Durotheca rogersii TaxID=419775 RepID=UPI00221EFA40|nr:lysophospholipase II [Durotheca rogersii]KAI5866055.1 lysophospholipase II [Durotheca rogersii]